MGGVLYQHRLRIAVGTEEMRNAILVNYDNIAAIVCDVMSKDS